MPDLSLSNNLGNSELELSIVFTTKEEFSFKGKNISNAKLTGEMTKVHKIGKANIISSFLDSLHANQVRFNNSDIKDSRIKNCVFENCDFNNASHNNNWIKDTHYSDCTFSQTSITLSEFSNCNFTNCDFTNVIISDCKFLNCVFSSCKTSNKMIESSLILDCSFRMMQIEIDTILSNFGLSSENTIDCSVWQLDENGKKKDNKGSGGIVKSALRKEANNIQKFKLEYYLDPNLILDVSEKLDSLFDINEWLKLCRNPNRFKLQIEKLHAFLLFQFDSNKLRLRTLFQLFDVSSELSDALSTRPDLLELQRTVDGVFLTLERRLERHFTNAKIILVKCEQDGACRLLVEGPLNLDYYTKELRELLTVAPVTFERIIKHNSPNEIFLHWEDIKNLWPLIVFIFSTKIKFELYKIEDDVNRIKSGNKQIVRGNEILTVESGFLEKSNNFSFRLKTLLPGQKGLSLVLQISPERYKKLIKIVKDIIVFDKKEKAA